MGPELVIHVDVGLVAQSEDKGSSEQEWTLSREFVLVNEEVIFGHNGIEGLSEDECSSTDQGRGQQRWSAVQGNILGNFVSMNGYYRNIGQGEVLKYLGKKLLPPH